MYFQSYLRNLFFVFCFTLFIGVFPITAYGKRIALVIGNANYNSPIESLPETIEDAKQVAQVLRELSFEIAHGSEYTNLTKEQMDEAITNFVNQLKSGDVALFYYSGHGTQDGFTNFLIPTDSEGLTDPSSVINLDDDILTPIGDRDVSINIVILDACRTINGVTGLAKASNTPNNTIIAYVTEPKKRADSPSPYTSSLINNIREPGLEIKDLFSRIRKEVREKTNNNQKPTAAISLESPFYFRQQASIEATILKADDDVKIKINDKIVSPQNILLKAGMNELEVRVYNQRTFTGGIEQLGGHQPEGWSYSIKFQTKNGDELAAFEGKEERPQKDGLHHGKEFTVIKATIKVDRISGKISIDNIQKFL